MSSIIFRRFKSKGPEFKGQKLASEKSRGTVKTLKRHITVIKAVNTKTRENGSRKMKSREPLWLPYILGEQNSLDITTNDVKSLRNPIRTNTVYIQHCTGTQMAWHT